VLEPIRPPDGGQADALGPAAKTQDGERKVVDNLASDQFWYTIKKPHQQFTLGSIHGE
jgi:hypothetical protein